MNTEIFYQYRDAANYKVGRTIVVQGKIAFGDIKSFLNDGEFFIPDDVSLHELQFELVGFPGNDDHPWHELQRDWFKPTRQLHTENMTACELIKMFQYAHDTGWDEKGAMARLGIR